MAGTKVTAFTTELVVQRVGTFVSAFTTELAVQRVGTFVSAFTTELVVEDVIAPPVEGNGPPLQGNPLQTFLQGAAVARGPGPIFN